MIATHNIKVNDRWYKAGDEIPEPKAAEQETVPEAKEEPVPAEEPKTEEKPKTTATRRKKISE